MSWLRRLSRTSRALFASVIVVSMLFGPVASAYAHGGHGSHPPYEYGGEDDPYHGADYDGHHDDEIGPDGHENDPGYWYDEEDWTPDQALHEDDRASGSRWIDEYGRRHVLDSDRDRDRDREEDDGEGTSKVKAALTAGAASVGMALSGVALAYLLPAVIGPVAWLPTALMWGSAAVAAPLFVYLYNRFLDREMNDNKILGLFAVGGLGLLGAIGAATLGPIGTIAGGLIGTVVGSAVGLPVFNAFAVEDGDDDDPVDEEEWVDDEEEWVDDGTNDELWDQYADVYELYEKVQAAYRRTLFFQRHGPRRQAELWMRRYRKLERIYREVRDDYEGDLDLYER